MKFSFLKKVVLVFSLTFIIISFALFSKGHFEVNASENINVTASVYSCDFRFQLSVRGNNGEVNYSTNAIIKFLSDESQSFILNMPIDTRGIASANLCDHGLYLQKGAYTVEVNVFESGYKSFKDPELFKYYQTNLNVELNKSDLTSKKVCSESENQTISQSSNEPIENTPNMLSDSIFSKDKLMFGGLLFFVPIFGKKNNRNHTIRFRINLSYLNIFKLFKNFIKTYLDSLKFSLLLIRSIIFTNG